jgi:DNA-3-methyladenine glycosylase I
MPKSSAPLARCVWADSSPAMQAYHDDEWGVPVHDGRALFAKLMLDGFQAGLSWSTILNKRDAFERAFEQFDPVKVAKFGPADVDRLLLDAGIVRSRAKIEATIGNARAYLAMQDAGEDFSEWCWSHVSHRTLVNRGKHLTQSDVSEAISKGLKQRGFKFVGPTIVYAWMQAVGLVDDHDEQCFRHHAKRAPKAGR